MCKLSFRTVNPYYMQHEKTHIAIHKFFFFMYLEKTTYNLKTFIPIQHLNL